jgi:hypothetical protein
VSVLRLVLNNKPTEVLWRLLFKNCDLFANNLLLVYQDSYAVTSQVDPNTFQQFLNFLYEKTVCVTPANAFGLAALAEEFQVPKLQKLILAKTHLTRRFDELIDEVNVDEEYRSRWEQSICARIRAIESRLGIKYKPVHDDP